MDNMILINDEVKFVSDRLATKRQKETLFQAAIYNLPLNKNIL
jgi:hypothetical protein